jgi:uncharacterized CHY-type Zn-finger protein
MSNKYLPSAFATRNQTTDKTIVDILDDDKHQNEGKVNSVASQQSKQCNACGLQITDNQFIGALDKAYHKKCFKCNNCNKEITTSSYSINKQNKLLCSLCAELDPTSIGAEECYKCKRAISGQGVKIQGRSFHKECFLCAVCHKEFTAGKVLMRDMGPVHESCKVTSPATPVKTPTTPSSPSPSTSSATVNLQLDIKRVRELHKLGLVSDEELNKAEQSQK